MSLLVPSGVDFAVRCFKWALSAGHFAQFGTRLGHMARPVTHSAKCPFCPKVAPPSRYIWGHLEHLSGHFVSQVCQLVPVRRGCGHSICRQIPARRKVPVWAIPIRVTSWSLCTHSCNKCVSHVVTLFSIHPLNHIGPSVWGFGDTKWSFGPFRAGTRC